MKIREIKLTNFKRFTETTIADIPETTRLVIVAGPNGCSKSSLIDAAHMWYRGHFAQNRTWDETYHRKQIAGASTNWNNAVSVQFHEPQPVTE